MPQKGPQLLCRTLRAQVWNLAASALATAFPVMSFDRRGHGNSDAAGKDYTFHQLGLDLIAIISQMRFDDMAVVGHSFVSGEDVGASA